ncbi:PilN domain-containing protein [Hippea sp. KM1]|uniref:PilN domain-containing protein n=1 Tax=Hippea sp. KM1 TaxID=944481 RepID=UPI00046C94D6|nr:hypothetical protein [Hippea sp. KM1]
MKEINLLPKDKRFSYKEYLLKRIGVAALVLNAAFLILVYVANVYFNTKLTKCIQRKKQVLNKISSLDAKLSNYESSYKNLTKTLIKLREEEKKLKSMIFIRKSAFASTIIYLNTFSKGVGFKGFSYENGYFKTTGIANSLSDFQRFYYFLEKNKYIKNLNLHSVKQKDGQFEFSISYEVVY